MPSQRKLNVCIFGPASMVLANIRALQEIPIEINGNANAATPWTIQYGLQDR